MPIYPGAHYESVTGHSNGVMRSHLGVVLHCNDALSTDLHDFFQSSSGSGSVSSHFQILNDGTVYQYIDTSQSSWCQGNGNDDYLSIESEGRAGDPATAAQIQAVGALLHWLNTAHQIPLQLAEAPGQPGLGWHGMGAAAGWGHAACPGVRKNQRSAMLAAAGDRGPLTSYPEDDLPYSAEQLEAFVRTAVMQVLRDPRGEAADIIAEAVWSQSLPERHGYGPGAASSWLCDARVPDDPTALAKALVPVLVPLLTPAITAAVKAAK